MDLVLNSFSYTRNFQKGVEVLIAGRPNVGKSSLMNALLEKDRVIVEGVNIIKKHTRPTQKLPQGGIVEKEAPIHVSNVLYYSTKFNTTTRIGYKKLDDGSKVRYCKNPECQGEIIAENE